MSLRVSQPFRSTSAHAWPNRSRSYPVLGARPRTASEASAVRPAARSSAVTAYRAATRACDHAGAPAPTARQTTSATSHGTAFLAMSAASRVVSPVRRPGVHGQGCGRLAVRPSAHSAPRSSSAAAARPATVRTWLPAVHSLTHAGQRAAATSLAGSSAASSLFRGTL